MARTDPVHTVHDHIRTKSVRPDSNQKMPLFQFRQLRRWRRRRQSRRDCPPDHWLRVFSGPDMALRDFINLLRRTLTRVCHQCDKAFVIPYSILGFASSAALPVTALWSSKYP